MQQLSVHWDSGGLYSDPVPLRPVSPVSQSPCRLFVCSGDHPRLHRGHDGKPHLLHLPGPDLQEGPQECALRPGECGPYPVSVVRERAFRQVLSTHSQCLITENTRSRRCGEQATLVAWSLPHVCQGFPREDTFSSSPKT